MDEQILTTRDLQNLPAKRQTHDPNAEPIVFHNQSIVDAIHWDQKGVSFPGVGIRHLIFSKCIFDKEIKIGDNQSEGRITFRECIFNSAVDVHARNISFESGCIFNSDLSIEGNRYGDTVIKELYLKGTLEVIGSTTKLSLKQLNTEKLSGKPEVLISANCQHLSIEKSIVKNLVLQPAEITGTFRLEEVEIEDVLVKNQLLSAEILLIKCKISNFLVERISRTGAGLTIRNSTVKEMSFKVDLVSKVSIIETSFGSLALSGANEKESVLNIEKADITNFVFHELFNNGLLMLRQITIPSHGKVAFKSCNLGKADFIYCDFSKATLEFENSKITEAFFSETEFPKKVLVNDKTNYAQAQLAFGQLSTAFQKQGDSIRASEFGSRELESHYRNIRWLSKDFFQKFNLWLNMASNNFGRSWIRGIIFSFVVGLILFSLLLISTKSYKFGLPSIDFNMLPAYLKFMNPIRFFEVESLFNGTPKQGKIVLNSMSYLADFGGRVLVAYGYYQTIQAFRRYGRK